LVWLAARIFVVLVDRVFIRWASRTPSPLDDRILRAIRRPGYLLILQMGIYGALHRYRFRLLGFLDGVLFVFSVALVIYTLTKIAAIFLHWYAERITGKREGETVARELLPLADKSLNLVLLIVGLVVVLDHFAIDIKSILVTLGVGSLAIGLALQDTLANMFAGFTIMLDGLFRIGDRIALQSGETGDVQAIGLRSTTLLTPDGNLLIVPNALLAKTVVTNLSFPDSRARVVVEVGVSFDADIEVAKKLILEAAQLCPYVRRDLAPSVVFKMFGESSVILRLVCFAASYLDVGSASDDIHSAINLKFKTAGIKLPLPGRALHLNPR
jgi:small-conductance mechanosensitive channel